MQTIFGGGGSLGRTDDELLSLFSTEAGERADAAFEALVERHGRMVHLVCEGVLGDTHAADDAFQATFLVLSRRARSLKLRGPLGPWLYGVARRVAQNARVDTARRRRHEREAARAMGSNAQSVDRHADFVPILHDAIAALPDRYRSAVVLCDLEGMTHDQAAQALRCPPGTVKSRLSRGRDRLRDRLQRQGFPEALAMGPINPMLGGPSPTLVQATVLAATSTTVVSTAIRTLVGKATWNMLLAKCATSTMILAAVGAVLGGLIAYAIPNAPQKGVTALPAVGLALEPAPVEAADLVSIYGLNLYKFELDAPAGTRFHIIFRELTAEDAPPNVFTSMTFQKTIDGPTPLLISVHPMDGSPRGALLAREEYASLAVIARGCTPGAYTGSIALPFRDRIELGGMIATGANGYPTAPGETVIFVTTPLPKAGEPASRFPCAQLVVVAED